MQASKSIAYAYPTSPNATKLGFDRTGCYTVELLNSKTRTVLDVYGFADFASAKAYADTLPEPFDRWNMESAQIQSYQITKASRPVVMIQSL